MTSKKTSGARLREDALADGCAKPLLRRSARAAEMSHDVYGEMCYNSNVLGTVPPMSKSIVSTDDDGTAPGIGLDLARAGNHSW